MRILGIETSCDDTAIGIIREQRGVFTIESQITASQALIHRKYGGVVPEVAAREHTVTIIPTLQAALKQAKVSWKDIDAIAVTGGPGLNSALLVGVETARTLAYVLPKPVIQVNHIKGHIASNWIGDNGSKIKFPAVALIVSGGHTELILIKKLGSYQLIGRTLDDAVGEAFDKVAKILDLPYPGGPEISRRAQSGDPQRFAFPRALMKRDNLDFSYAGLKTAVLYELRKHKKSARLVNDMAASFQVAALEPLVTKTLWAVQKTGAKTVLLGGGVAANAMLREKLSSAIEQTLPHVRYVQPALNLCMDNGVMIAIAGAFQAKKKKFTPWKKLLADPNWELA